MKLLDLFAGIGGFSLAGHWMGWETVAFVEWDSFCQKVLKKNFPGIPIFGDIIEFNKQLQNGEIEIIQDTICGRCLHGESKKEGAEIWEQREFSTRTTKRIYREKIERPDIITGGFPCQPFSQAGKRKGTDDSRYLWPEMLTTIRTLKPSFVVGENVAGLVSMENGKTLERIFSDLENEGYTVESFIIPACGVGAWHRRDRIWILAYSLDSTDRTRRGQESETEGIQGENEQTGCAGMPCRTGKDVSDTSSQGLQGSKETRNNGTDGQKFRDKQFTRCNRGAEYWSVEPELGKLAYGLPPELDGYWKEEPDIPRVATGIPNRVNRLKALGNSIVPQVVFEIFKAIDETFNTRKQT